MKNGGKWYSRGKSKDEEDVEVGGAVVVVVEDGVGAAAVRVLVDVAGVAAIVVEYYDGRMAWLSRFGSGSIPMSFI